ncbi:MAG TPA: 3-hydroxyacyl-CoA dehydrogenase family protein [Chitinophagaceae bacterium]|nr:3-hydroxyacyl-CoA dehydrogenase family protein [Chitinophagaceae bacterium]
MKVIILCNEIQEKEIISKPTATDVNVSFTNNKHTFYSTYADAYFDLLADELNLEILRNDIPVFINSVIQTCKELPNNCIRLNAWNGFLKNEIIEIATLHHLEYVEKVMNKLSWKYQVSSDDSGLIVPKIISMIVNEAYFALEDNISTKEEIDIAMKLGTNYPYGPFEWSEKIGLKIFIFY